MSVELKFDLTSLEKGLKKMIKQAPDIVYDAVDEATTIIGNEAEAQVPLDKGTLRDSWKKEKLPSGVGQEIGFHTPYAARLHEHPEYKFKNGRKAKYLEDPINQNLGDWQGRLLNNLKKLLE
jgi:hypothetical protein